MFSLLIGIIYLAFISLGLPDSLLGSAWPAMHADIGATVSSAGVVQMLISASTIVSALFSGKLTRKFGTGGVTAISVFLTAAAMLAFSFCPAFWMICLFAIPYGLGAGAIDSCLNNYVALHLSSRHMNWLHCCWGIGATVSPYIMSMYITGEDGWRGGYRLVAIIQFALTLIMALSIPLWKKYSNHEEKQDEATQKPVKALTTRQVLRYPGTIYSFVGFMFYCLMEVLPIVWTSTYLNTVYALDVKDAAFFASLFAVGMALSRALCGMVSKKFNDRQMMRCGMYLVIASAVLMLIPSKSYVLALVAFGLLGFGCGPIYPGFVHSVPTFFGKAHSGEIIGVQLAFAYVGFTFSSAIFGKIADWTSIKALPVVILVYAVLCLLLFEKLNRFMDKAKRAQS